ADQYSRLSSTTPFGARTKGGFALAPTGSLANVARTHSSDHASGIGFLPSGMPAALRFSAASTVTMRYAPSAPPVSVSDLVSRSHTGAYSTRRLSFAVFFE